MPRPVLVLETDQAMRKLLQATLSELNLKALFSSPEELMGHLQHPTPYGCVLVNSIFTQDLNIDKLAKARPPGEHWILMAPPDGTKVSSINCSVIVQPFRASELKSILQGEETKPEDAVLQFMRERERDLTQFRRKEMQLREAHRNLKESERMKNTFLSLVSHELRTPLTLISGNLQVLRKLASKWGNPIANDCLGSAHDGAKRLAKLVDELLRFTVSIPQGREHWDLALTLRRIVGELQPAAKQKGLSLELSTTSLPIEGDPAGLPDALLQLIENALVFNKPGGKVQITAKQLVDSNEIEIQVADDGPGIDKIELKRVFHPFYQVADVNTRSVEGLGLGLSLARRTIESHGGRLALYSTPGHGTQAIATLPIRWYTQAPPMRTTGISPPPAHTDVASLQEYAQEIYELWESEQTERRRAQEQKMVLERTFIETLVSLMQMVDPRMSGGTSQGERVLEYARSTARHLDPALLSRPEFLYGLLFYDIGKIGVTESVLSKTGSLTDKERLAAQAHSEIGARLLTSAGVLQPAIEAIRSHHEKWDGSGYPDGLKGQEIPILARIIAVVDSFDAMTVNRPWRPALSPEAARTQIEKGSGASFDPAVVEAFSRAWGEIFDAFTNVSTKSGSKDAADD